MSVALRGGAIRVTQIPAEDAFFPQLLDVADPLITWPLELLYCQFRLAIGGVKLLCSLAHVPLRFEGRKHARDFLKADAIRPRVRTGVRRKLKTASGNDVGDDLGYLADAIVVRSLAYVERLVEDLVFRRLESGNEGARNILDMNDRTPGRAVDS